MTTKPIGFGLTTIGSILILGSIFLLPWGGGYPSIFRMWLEKPENKGALFVAGWGAILGIIVLILTMFCERVTGRARLLYWGLCVAVAVISLLTYLAITALGLVFTGMADPSVGIVLPGPGILVGLSASLAILAGLLFQLIT